MFFEKSKIEVEKYPHVERKLATATEKGYVKINGEEIRPKIDLCYQQGLQENMLTTEADILFLGGEPGSGKALSINELVCTPNGFVRNGDLKVGDIISGVDGLPQTVLGVYDQGEMDTYEIEFNDGSKTRCTLDHLWAVKPYKNSREWKVVSFDRIKRNMDSYSDSYFEIPLYTGSENSNTQPRWFKGYSYYGKEECRCIEVSNKDNLYVVSKDFIVTHNTYGLLLAALQGIDKKGYSGLIIKKELVSTKDTAGGMMQDAKIVLEEFADCQYRASDNPTFIYPTWGSAVSFTHSNFESTTEKRVREAQERAKNFQCSFIAFDELTNFSFDNWWYWTSRNRDSSGMKSKMVCTFNTNSHHFTRTMIDWYIGEDGRVIEDRIGKIRYFYKQGETERDFVWGNSKEEVIRKAGLTVREDLKEAGINPETMVKSFTFMPSRMVDNRILINATEGGHVANIANMGGAEREKLFDSNWNADTSGDAIVTRDMIKDIFKNEGIEDETMYATLDVSGGGDNCIMIIWRGLRIKHILKFDGLTNDRSQFYKELEVWIDRVLTKHNVSVYNFAFDATGNGQYLKSYTNGRPIVGNMSAIAEYDEAGNKVVVEQYFNLRSQLMGKMHYLLDMGMIGCDIEPNQLFNHGRHRTPRELEDILCEEADVFMRTTRGNKYYFKSKDEFKDRYNYSPDFIDPIIYRAIFEIEKSKKKEQKKVFTQYNYRF